MKIPNVQTKNGKLPLTALPNKALVEGFISFSDEPESVDLVRLLSYVEPSSEKAGKILRSCLADGKELIAFYPRIDKTPPAKATLLGSIPDGVLYLV